MAPTLRRVTAMASLRLGVLAGGEDLERPVRWVAVSELEDPTPFLEGAELLLTTGMRLHSADAVPYISRLVARGVAGLGFGVGLSHAVVPESFVEAAAEAGLPLIEIPRNTPFIAIGKAVSELLAAEQYEEISRAFAAQGRLTRAALQAAGPSAVIDRLAREIDGWALLLDDAGAVRDAAGFVEEVPGVAGKPRIQVAGKPHIQEDGRDAAEKARARADGRDAAEKARMLEPELARLRRITSPTSLALATPDEHVIVQPLGRRGFFAVGRARPFTPIGHTIVNAAGSLLTLALEQGRDQRVAEGRVRSAVLRLLLAGQGRAARETLAAIGGDLPDGPVLVLMCAPDDPEGLADALPCFTAPWGKSVVALIPEEKGDHLMARAAAYGRVGVSAPVRGSALVGGSASARESDQGGGPAGAGDSKTIRAVARAVDLADAVDQAERALAAAAPVARFADLAGEGLLSLLDPVAAASFAAALLAPLRGYGSRADLIESLRAYLACNGHWDAAAQRLGVHRHTLRYRMKRVSELIGRDLDDPAARAELWFALSLSASRL